MVGKGSTQGPICRLSYRCEVQFHDEYNYNLTEPA